jgi:hypothetical protein
MVGKLRVGWPRDCRRERRFMFITFFIVGGKAESK